MQFALARIGELAISQIGIYQNNDSRKKLRINLLVLGVFFIFIFALSMTTAPTDFATGRVVTIESGQTIRQAAGTLRQNKIIRLSTFFGFVVSISGRQVVEGDYFFPAPINLFKVVNRITTGSYAIPTKQVTFFEGMTLPCALVTSSNCAK